MYDVHCVKGLLKFLQKAAPHMKEYRTIAGKTTQSSVALIFRLNPELTKFYDSNKIQQTIINEGSLEESIIYRENILNENYRILNNYLDKLLEENSTASVNKSLVEILLIQRAKVEGDLHSGQIAYPGGKNNKGESDFHTVAREVQEEVGLNLLDNESFIFLGKIPRNFFVYYRRETEWMLSVHVFFQKNPLKQTIKLCEREIDNLFWCPLNRFLSFDEQSLFQNKQTKTPSDVFTSSYLLRRLYFEPVLKNNFHSGDFCYFRLRNGELFYGISFQILSHVLLIMLRNTPASLSEEMKIHKRRSEKFVNRAFQFRLNFKPGPFGFFHTFIFNKLYHRKRFLQFGTYYEF